MQHRRTTAGLVAGAGLAVASALATAVPAQAYGSELNTYTYYRDTDTCPCTLSDPIDNTYFQHDPGGKAVKVNMRIESGSVNKYAGKLEFHPSGENIWLYDGQSDGDTIYVRYRYQISGSPDGYTSPIHAPKNGSGPTIDADIPEGWSVHIDVYDDAQGKDRIGTWTGIA